MVKNEITTTLRISEEKHEEFKKYADEMSISLNSLIKIAASIGLKMLKGEYTNIAFLDIPEQI